MAHLTSKHYQAIAAALATVRPQLQLPGRSSHYLSRLAQWKEDCGKVADTLERMASPVCRFDRAKWEKALGVD